MRHLVISLLLPLLATGPAPQGRVEPAATAHSYLTIVSSGKPAEFEIDVRRQRLVLISPDGEQSTLLRHKVSRWYEAMQLVDWSPDGRTALLRVGLRHGRSEVTAYDLTTGQTRTLRLGQLVSDVILDSAGTGVVTMSFNDEGTTPYVLQRIAWDGTVTTLPATSTGPVLAGPDHTLMTTDRRSMQVVSLDTGATLRTFQTGSCTPARWWDDASVLVTCGEDLSVVDWATGARTALTDQHGRGDYGHLDARDIDSGRYVQVAGACGTTFVSHQGRKGAMRKVDVPGAVGNIVMVDGVGRWLVIQHASDCEGNRPRSVLSRFDPTTQQERPLVVLGPRQAFWDLRVLGEVTATPL